VQVVEMFWYGCPHCYEFDPMLEKWRENKPDNVEFIRIPAIFNNKRWSLHAQAFYTADLLGISEKFHKPFFDAIHQGGQRMDSKEAIKAFFAKFGIDGDTFDETFDSFAVQSKVRRAADLTKKYGISGVPTMVINGKYQTGGRQARTYPRMLKITDALIAREAAKKSN
jgi:thiol:disulfide interchange protein DsbA